MTGFWPLFRKEVRFLTAPAIVFFTFVHLPIRIAIYLLNTKFRSYYNQTVIHHLDETTLMNTFVWNPILHDGVLNFMYSVLLLFALIHEQNSRSKILADMLPVKRITHILATFSAFAFWVVALHAVLPIFYKILLMLINTQSAFFLSYSIMLYGEMSYALKTLAVASTALFGFTVTVTLPKRWWRYAAGVITGVIGYMVMTGSETFLQRNIGTFMPMVTLPGGNEYMTVDMGSILLPDAVFLPLFVIASMLLYERFNEV